MAWHSFGGWKRSIFRDHHIYGEEGIRFYTRYKSIMQRWPAGEPARIELSSHFGHRRRHSTGGRKVPGRAVRHAHELSVGSEFGT